jgi:hypothetical protein
VDDGQCGPPTYREVESSIQILKNNKALGGDNITAELIKCGGKAVTEALHKLITLTLCGPLANLLAFGFQALRTGSQLFGF